MRISVNKPIVLVGMMGSGKSTIGKRLAYKLNLQFYDSDKIIEEREGLSLMDIYDFRGEEYFKEQEVKVISEILDYGVVVLSTGGESFLHDAVREKVKQKAVSVWLKTDVSILHERVSKRNNRPQLMGDNKLEMIEEMVEKSYPVFSEADVIVESKDMEAHFVVDTILSRIKALMSSR
jgi:shikimate kinase